MLNLKKIAITGLILLIFFGVISRFIGLNWDQGHYLHPDERLYVNTSIAWPSDLKEFFSTESPLNPKMFYYGSLPLYLYTFFYRLVLALDPLSADFLIISRLTSAFFSLLTIFLVYKLAQKLMPKPWSLLATALFTLSVGSIQAVHFNTTETILTFFIILLTLLSFNLLKIVKTTDNREQITKTDKAVVSLSLELGAILGLSAASKITAFSFVLSPLAALLVCFNKLKWKKLVITGFLMIVTTGLFFFLGSPYNLIDFDNFRKTQGYIQNVVVGNLKPPFVIIYEGTIPYFYQLTHVFPWIFSPLGFLFAILGFLLLWVLLFKNRKSEYLIFLLWPTIYFLVAGSWFNKFIRYYVPLLPFLAISGAFFFYWLFEKIDGKDHDHGRDAQIARLYKKSEISPWQILGYTLLLITIFLQSVYTLSFVNEVYLKTNTRIAASYWIYQNIKPQSTIAAEHWDDRLPLGLSGFNPSQYRYQELAVYDSESPEKIEKLANQLSQSNYLILSSRRVFYSILQNKKNYPLTSSFYEKLFLESLGFKLIEEERRFFRPLVLAINDDRADESFQSYDHPPVFIFQNNERIPAKELLQRITKEQFH